MIERSVTDGILTLQMAHGKASALDLELCQRLQHEFEFAAEAHDIAAVVLTGSGSIFSAGVDLPRLVNAGGTYVQDFVEALEAMLRAMFLFPKPAVAAVNGHAIAGGAIMAFACDYRIMSAGRIGVPEALVGVPFPPLALELVRFAVPKQHLHSLLYLARTVESDEAKSMGIIDEVVNHEMLLTRANAIARQIAAITPEAFRLTKRQLREPYLRDAAQIAVSSADDIDALWAAPATHEHIKAYLARTIGKK
ncbi:MAG TPA: enoyl-CoA hydratase/isomerase family protein [Thermoanaerobaculia bacterium]|nr:enoyl-CoA hydratase/isomerase family protein [Thermoanaerobaculia bacterium]